MIFERIVREGGLLENFIEVVYFSVLEGESDSYGFLIWYKGFLGRIAFFFNCIFRLVESF